MRVVVSLLFSVLVLVPVQAMTDWAAVTDRVEKSVMQISNTCSAFAIDNDRDFALTAKHCTSDDPSKPTIVDLVPSTVVADDIQFDLTVLRVPGMDRPALKLAAHTPKRLEEMVSFGYGYGLKTPMPRLAHVSMLKVTIPSLDGEWMMFDGAFVGGQSGSPAVNSLGEVIALVQLSTDRAGIGRSAAIIKDRVGKYFEKPKTP